MSGEYGAHYAALMMRCWNGECAVYNSVSGEIHLVSELNAQLLELMASGVDKNKLLTKVMDNYQLEIEESEILLSNLREEYQKLGLVTYS